MKKKMSKSQTREKNSLGKNAAKGEKLLMYMIALYTFGMVVVNAMKMMGCLDFRSYIMSDTFYAGALYLCLILVYENSVLKEKQKIPFMGVLIGSILSVCDGTFYLLLIVFGANIIIPEFLEGKNWKNILKNPIKVFFYSMMTLEVYSICMILNEFLYTTRVETSILFKFLDVICVCAMLLFFLCDKETEEKKYVEEKSESDEQCVFIQIIKQCIWYLLIMVILVMVAAIFYKNTNNGIEGATFFLGKSIDRGYLLCEGSERDWFYFANRPESGLGTVLQNTSSYELISLGMEMSYPKIMLYAGEFLCQILYGIGGVLTVIMVYIMYFINRAIGLKKNLFYRKVF